MTKTYSDLSYIVTRHSSLPAGYAETLAGQPEHKGSISITGGGGAAELRIHGDSDENDIYISVERNLKDPANGRSFELSSQLTLRNIEYDYFKVKDLNDDGVPDVVIYPTGSDDSLTVISQIDTSLPIGAGLVNNLGGLSPSANIYDNEEDLDASCDLIYSINFYASYDALPEEIEKAYRRADQPVEAHDFENHLEALFSYWRSASIGDSLAYGRKISLTLHRDAEERGQHNPADIKYTSDSIFDYGRGVHINNKKDGDQDLDFIVDTDKEEKEYLVFQSKKPFKKAKRGLCLIDQTAPFPRGFGGSMEWTVSVYEPPVERTPFSANPSGKK